MSDWIEFVNAFELAGAKGDQSHPAAIFAVCMGEQLMTWLWWGVPLVFVLFVLVLNSFLRGSAKELVTVGLLSVIAIILVVAWVVSGWQYALAAVASIFILPVFLHPIALFVARKMVTHPDLGFAEYNRHRLAQTTRDFGTDEGHERHEREREEESRHKKQTIAKAMKTPRIVNILHKCEATERDLIAFYERFEVHSLPPDARRMVLLNPLIVAFFLDSSTPCELYDGRYSRDVSRNTHLRLILWTHSNPGGKEPK